MDSYPPYKLYYIDEFGFDEYLHREYGYSPIGTPVIGEVRGKKYERTNVVAAKCCGKIVAPIIYDGTTDHILFEYWFEKLLLKHVPKYSVFIMDNATFHRKSVLRELAKNADCEVLFLPPYSPDLNPIENWGAWLKGKLRSILPQFDSLHNALVDCFKLC